MKTSSPSTFVPLVWRHPLETVLCCVLVAMVLVTFSQVVARYVLQAPLSWSEELARFLLMWLSMLSAAYAFKKKAHFALRFVVDALHPTLQRAVRVVVVLAVASFLVVFTFMSITFVIGVEGHRAPALQIPMAVPYSSAIVGGMLMLYYLIKNAWYELFVVAEANGHDS